jgi:hypothetical protein
MGRQRGQGHCDIALREWITGREGHHSQRGHRRQRWTWRGRQSDALRAEKCITGALQAGRGIIGREGIADRDRHNRQGWVSQAEGHRRQRWTLQAKMGIAGRQTDALRIGSGITGREEHYRKGGA